MLWDSAESCRKRQVSGHCDELFLGQTALYKVKNKEQMSRVSFLWKMSIFLKPASFCKSDFTSETLVQLLVRENQLISNAGRQGLYGLQYLLPLTTSVQLIPVIIIIIIICALLVMSACLPACLSHLAPHACLHPHTVACPSCVTNTIERFIRDFNCIFLWKCVFVTLAVSYVERKSSMSLIYVCVLDVFQNSSRVKSELRSVQIAGLSGEFRTSLPPFLSHLSSPILPGL